MASLKKGDLDKSGNDEILLKKFFSLDNRMNSFLCKTQSQEGQFVPLGLVFMVDGDEIAGFQNDQSGDYDEALARLRENMKLAGTRNKVFFTGTWQNTKQIETISLTDLEKTDEFGGQVGGKKVNLGIQFENDFYKSLQCELQCEDKNTKYKKDARPNLKSIVVDLPSADSIVTSSYLDGDIAAIILLNLTFDFQTKHNLYYCQYYLML